MTIKRQILPTEAVHIADCIKKECSGAKVIEDDSGSLKHPVTAPESSSAGRESSIHLIPQSVVIPSYEDTPAPTVETEQDLDSSFNVSSVSSTGVYYNNSEVYTSLLHPLQLVTANTVVSKVSSSIPRGRPLPCPPRLHKIESPLHVRPRAGVALSKNFHLDAQKRVLPSTQGPLKRRKMTSQKSIVLSPALTREQALFVEAAVALRTAGSAPTARPVVISDIPKVMPPPPFALSRNPRREPTWAPCA